MRRASYYYFRSLLFILIGLCLTWPCAAQDPNPQSGFAPTVLLADPSFYLNFNDQNTSFMDQISGQSFIGEAVVSVSIGTITGLLNTTLSGYAVFNNAPLVAGTLTSVSIQFPTTPSVESAIICIATVSGDTVTITNSFVITVAATSAVQTFVGGGVNFPTTTVSAGQILGFWVSSSGMNIADDNGSRFYFSSPSSVPSGPNTYTSDTNKGQAIIGTVEATFSSGTVTPRQPGFDSTLLNNTSAEFPWNGWSAAPNNTLGAIEWSSPWSMMVQVDRLNWSRTGKLVLASKGDVTSQTYWQLYLQMNGSLSQLCFDSWGLGTKYDAENGVCTSTSLDVMPNGYNYNIVVEDNGTGGNGVQYPASGWSAAPAKTIYVNGLGYSVPESTEGAEAVSFGGVNVTVSGGTGYAGQTAFTSSGGGSNCHVSGVMWATGGVPYNTAANWFPSGSQNYGCTSVPTLTLTSPTGSGATLTVALDGETMNSTTSPLMVPGYVSGGITYGVAGATSTQTPTYLDEFAIFPSYLTQTQIQSLFYWSKFYQGLLGTPPPNRVAFIFDDDGCGDEDNFWALQGAIAAERAGYVQIEGVIQENSIGYAASLFRQMLDQAGLSNVPLGVANSGNNGYFAGCSSALLGVYNASTYNGVNALTDGAYPPAATVYRQVLAANPTSPVMVFSAGQLDGMAEFMQSSADSISSLTGLQLWNQDAANGAAVYTQGGSCPPSSSPATSPCTGNIGAQAVQASDMVAAAYVYNNNGAMPMIAVSDTPQGSGPGPLYTRTSKDPMYLMTNAEGTDTRTAWDSLPMSAFITSYFTGGVTVGYSGGTGYAAQTTFTSTGGGANCNVQGIMTASGGVPNGITTTWGQALPLTDSYGQVVGLGFGCTSAPTLVLTSPTGAGVTLTAYLAKVCGTASFSGSPLVQSFTTGTCSNHYISPMSVTANQGQTPIFQWFLNSLIDPPPNGRPTLF
jgi:hypothetical protein